MPHAVEIHPTLAYSCCLKWDLTYPLHTGWLQQRFYDYPQLREVATSRDVEIVIVIGERSPLLSGSFLVGRRCGRPSVYVVLATISKVMASSRIPCSIFRGLRPIPERTTPHQVTLLLCWESYGYGYPEKPWIRETPGPWVWAYAQRTPFLPPTLWYDTLKCSSQRHDFGNSRYSWSHQQQRARVIPVPDFDHYRGHPQPHKTHSFHADSNAWLRQRFPPSYPYRSNLSSRSKSLPMSMPSSPFL